MMMIDKFLHPSEKGYRWFVYVADSGHVLAQGYHPSAKVAGNQMETAFMHTLDEWGESCGPARAE